jgi:hypothetical protein
MIEATQSDSATFAVAPPADEPEEPAAADPDPLAEAAPEAVPAGALEPAAVLFCAALEHPESPMHIAVKPAAAAAVILALLNVSVPPKGNQAEARLPKHRGGHTTHRGRESARTAGTCG